MPRYSLTATPTANGNTIEKRRMAHRRVQIIILLKAKQCRNLKLTISLLPFFAYAFFLLVSIFIFRPISQSRLWLA